MTDPGIEVNPPVPAKPPRQRRRAGVRRVHVGAYIEAEYDADITAFAAQDKVTRSGLLTKWVEQAVAARRRGHRLVEEG